MSKNKNIIITIATGLFPPQIGGPATYSKLLLDELPKRGIEVRIVSFGDVLFLPKGIRHVFYFFKLLKKAMGSDIIYAQDPVSVGLPALYACKILRKRFMLKIVGDYAWEQGVQRAGVSDKLDTFSEQLNSYPNMVKRLKLIQTKVANGADTIIVPSNYLKKIVTNWGVNADNIFVIYNGFELPNLPFTKSQARDELKLSGEIVVSVGRLVPWKGFRIIISAIGQLTGIMPDIKLYIVGDGPDKSLLAKDIMDRNLSKNVILTGKMNQNELFKFIKASDVFVLNTSYEGFSHQLLEVMALETPLITTPVGGNTEIIRDEINGILVGFDDEKSFVSSIKNILTDKEKAKNLSRNACLDVKKFSDTTMLDKITEKIYEVASS